MKLRNLPISMQLGLGRGIILVMVLFLGVLSWSQAESLWQETQGLYEHPLQVRRAVGEIKADILVMDGALKEAIHAETDQEIEQALQTIDRHESDAHRQFSIVYDLYLGSRSEIEATERAFEEWRAIRDETIRLLRAGQTTEAASRTRSTGVAGRHVEKILGALDTLSDFAIARGDEFYQDAQQKRDTLLLRLALVIGVILLVATSISYALLRGIRNPLRELTTVTERYRRGDMDARSRYISNNELGALATSFNSLADTVKGELQSRAMAAGVADVMLREDELSDFSKALLGALLEHTGSQVGAIYLLSASGTTFEHLESIGLGSGSRPTFDATTLEGEFGVALATRQIQHITAIPSDTRFTFSTVSGDFQPRELLTVPIIAGQQVVAMIALASIRPYPDRAVRLVRDVWGVMTARTLGVLAYQKIRAFSERLETQNRELEAQAQELTTQAAELSEQNVELEMQKQQLDEANRLKSAFLSNMSHELRTPLNSVIALAGVLGRRLRNTIPSEEYGYLEVIERNGQNLLALINDILDLSRIEAGRENVTLSSFSIGALVNEVAETIGPQAAEKGLVLLRQVAENLPPITSDIEKCRHILVNLVGNAVKFTEAGHVTITADKVDYSIRVVVTDTGIGIAADQLPFIFEEFHQADNGSARKYGGTGLGLAIARKHATLLGGRIDVASTLGRGSAFTLTLPLAGSLAAELPLPSASDLPTESLDHSVRRGTRILLVEDSEPAVIQVTDTLAEEGYQVQVARNGREALAAIADTPPDAMILDLMMPEVDGFAVLRAVRSAERTARLPVLILTAKHVTPEELSFLKGNHIHELIQKGGISRAELLSAVGKLVAFPPSGPLTVQLPDSARPDGKPVILVVEDNPDNMQTVRALLKDTCTLIEAVDGPAGVDQAVLHTPDLVLLDVSLPRMDGYRTLDALRAEEKLRRTPIIALTARAMRGDREEILARGFDGYLAKPVDLETLTSTIQEFLHGRQVSQNPGH